MITIFDHLSSILIASAVILILMVAQHRSSHAAVEQVATHSVKAKTLVFGHWIERDILDLGKNMGRNRFRFKMPTTDSLGNTSRFHFFSDSTCTDGCSFPGGINIAVGDTARLHTRYKLVPTKRVVLRDTTGHKRERQLMRLDREVAATKVTDGNAPDPAASAWRQGSLDDRHALVLQGRDAPARRLPRPERPGRRLHLRPLLRRARVDPGPRELHPRDLLVDDAQGAPLLGPPDLRLLTARGASGARFRPDSGRPAPPPILCLTDRSLPMGKALIIIVLGAGFLLARQGFGNQLTEQESRKDQVEYENEVLAREIARSGFNVAMGIAREHPNALDTAVLSVDAADGKADGRFSGLARGGQYAVLAETTTGHGIRVTSTGYYGGEWVDGKYVGGAKYTMTDSYRIRVLEVREDGMLDVRFLASVAGYCSAVFMEEWHDGEVTATRMIFPAGHNRNGEQPASAFYVKAGTQLNFFIGVDQNCSSELKSADECTVRRYMRSYPLANLSSEWNYIHNALDIPVGSMEQAQESLWGLVEQLPRTGRAGASPGKTSTTRRGITPQAPVRGRASRPSRSRATTRTARAGRPATPTATACSPREGSI